MQRIVPQYVPTSPPYAPESPPYAPGMSPAYGPNSAPYVPTSPAYKYDTNSPGYHPITPDEETTKGGGSLVIAGITESQKRQMPSNLTGGSQNIPLQPAEVKPPAINININVPQIGGDEEKVKSAEENKVDKITSAVEEANEGSVIKLSEEQYKENTNIGKPSDGSVLSFEPDESSENSDNTPKGGGEKKKVSFSRF